MKVLLNLLAAAMLLGTSPLLAQGEDPQPTKKTRIAKEDNLTAAQLQSRLLRAMADLAEAQEADHPDDVKIAQLTRDVRLLRQRMAAKGVAAQGGPGLGGGCGFCPGCPWAGTGQCPAFGPQGGRGPGFGPGPGYGRGMGRGYGRGFGWGRGAGRGFIDENRNGICDNYERGYGPKKP